MSSLVVSQQRSATDADGSTHPFYAAYLATLDRLVHLVTSDAQHVGGFIDGDEDGKLFLVVDHGDPASSEPRRTSRTDMVSARRTSWP